MTPEQQKLLEETAELARENHRLLKKIHNSMRLGRAIRITYWVLIIGSAIGAFYFLQPYIDQLTGVYTGIQDSASNVNSLLNAF